MQTRQNSLGIKWEEYEFDGACPGCDLCRDCEHAHDVGTYHRCKPADKVRLVERNGITYSEPIYPSYDSRCRSLTRVDFIDVRDAIFSVDYAESENRAMALEAQSRGRMKRGKNRDEIKLDISKYVEPGTYIKGISARCIAPSFEINKSWDDIEPLNPFDSESARLNRRERLDFSMPIQTKKDDE